MKNRGEVRLPYSVVILERTRRSASTVSVLRKMRTGRGLGITSSCLQSSWESHPLTHFREHNGGTRGPNMRFQQGIGAPHHSQRVSTICLSEEDVGLAIVLIFPVGRYRSKAFDIPDRISTRGSLGRCRVRLPRAVYRPILLASRGVGAANPERHPRKNTRPPQSGPLVSRRCPEIQTSRVSRSGEHPDNPRAP